LAGLGAALLIFWATLFGGGYRRYSRLPYGPYILLASYLVWLFPSGAAQALQNWLGA